MGQNYFGLFFSLFFCFFVFWLSWNIVQDFRAKTSEWQKLGPANHVVLSILSLYYSGSISVRTIWAQVKTAETHSLFRGSIEWQSPERDRWSCQMKWIDLEETWPVCLLLGSDDKKRKCEWTLLEMKYEGKLVWGWISIWQYPSTPKAR